MLVVKFAAVMAVTNHGRAAVVAATMTCCKNIMAKGQYATAMQPENQGSAAAEGLLAAWQPNQQGIHGIVAKGLEVAE